MKKVIMTLCLAALFISAAADAVPVKLGTASGGLMIYYNNIDNSGAGGVPDGIVSGYDENPQNQAYIKAQFGYSNTNGAYFQFDNTDLGGFNWNDIFSGQPVGSSQFGFDLQTIAGTYNPAGGVTIPGVSFADNTDNNAANALLTPVIPPSAQAWAINDYQGGAQAGTLINSLFRGTSFTMAVTGYQQVGNIYTMSIAGQLNSDGLFHWYTVGKPDSTLASWKLSNTLYYTGTLSYDKTGDYGADQKDFYAGNIDIFVDVIPEPATLVLLGLGGLVLRKVRA